VSLTVVLNKFKSDVAQCDSLIANAHRTGADGNPLFPAIDREQITVAAFLNMFKAWEAYLESSVAELMIGTPTMSGTAPTKYISPLCLNTARKLVIGVMKFFDYGNHDLFKKLTLMYFENGYPFEPHISAIFSDLGDLRTMRNASAHIASTTQTALESLAVRLFSQPKPNITSYQLLTANDPQSSSGSTIFSSYKDKLLVTAELIATG
jgi:hypothetical protein